MKKYFIAFCLLLAGCVSIPEGVQPVSDFNLERYLGRWYEIARLDHSFEKGLSRVTADYSLRPDGGVKVINRGFSAADQKWKEATGKAYFVQAPEQGFLKVSFFGPFYGSYVIFALDRESYRYSLVCGPDKSYLWILARTPTLEKTIVDNLVQKAKTAGFDTEKLIYVNQN